jgi:hypothetical protein
MAVDQQQFSLVASLFGMTCEVNLANGRQRKLGQILLWREAVISRGDEDLPELWLLASISVRTRSTLSVRTSAGRFPAAEVVAYEHRPFTSGAHR